MRPDDRDKLPEGRRPLVQIARFRNPLGAQLTHERSDWNGKSRVSCTRPRNKTSGRFCRARRRTSLFNFGVPRTDLASSLHFMKSSPRICDVLSNGNLNGFWDEIYWIGQVDYPGSFAAIHRRCTEVYAGETSVTRTMRTYSYEKEHRMNARAIYCALPKSLTNRAELNIYCVGTSRRILLRITRLVLHNRIAEGEKNFRTKESRGSAPSDNPKFEPAFISSWISKRRSFWSLTLPASVTGVPNI